jgi:hypothetical protein
VMNAGTDIWQCLTGFGLEAELVLYESVGIRSVN